MLIDTELSSIVLPCSCLILRIDLHALDPSNVPHLNTYIFDKIFIVLKK